MSFNVSNESSNSAEFIDEYLSFSCFYLNYVIRRYLANSNCNFYSRISISDNNIGYIR